MTTINEVKMIRMFTMALSFPAPGRNFFPGGFLFPLYDRPLEIQDEMRRYALEKLEDLSDNEARIINTNPPEINSNFDQTPFAFTWNVSEDDSIEVLITPPPCIPMSAFRTRQVTYM
jgi:hypothetical protein